MHTRYENVFVGEFLEILILSIPFLKCGNVIKLMFKLPENSVITRRIL